MKTTLIHYDLRSFKYENKKPSLKDNTIFASFFKG